MWKKMLKWLEDRRELKMWKKINKRYNRGVRKNRVITSWRTEDE